MYYVLHSIKHTYMSVMSSCVAKYANQTNFQSQALDSEKTLTHMCD